MKQLVINVKGEKTSDVELAKEIWGIVPNDTVLYDALTLYRNSLRQGTASTKKRSEVSGGGKKPWKQKGTGNARQGSIRSPQWVGGGVVFGPHPRSFSKKMNKKERRLALKSALTYKMNEKNIVIVDEFKLETSKTKEVKALLNNLKLEGKVLIIVNELTDNAVLATRNLRNVMLLTNSEINVYDVINADKLLIECKAVKAIEEVL